MAEASSVSAVVTGPGCPTVLIGKMPAAQIGNMHVCPMVTPGVPPIPHIGGPIVGPVPPTVLIGKMPAACVGDMCICVGPPSTILPPGCPTVLFGQAGGGGGGGGGGGSSGGSSTSQSLEAGTIQPVQGTETFPICVQATILECKPYMTPAGLEQLIQLIADSPTQEEEKLTIADIVEILEGVESEEGFEAARFFASHLDYGTLTKMTTDFISGVDTNPDNDPNIMPTRFMILFGADDSKLQQIDDHPDKFDGEEHQINVANLRKGLKLLGYEVADCGVYDEEVYSAHAQYLASAMADYSFDGLEEDGVGIIEVYFEDEHGTRIERIKSEQDVFLLVKTCGLQGKKLNIDLSDIAIDFEYNSKMILNDKISDLAVTNDNMRLKLRTHKQRSR